MPLPGSAPPRPGRECLRGGGRLRRHNVMATTQRNHYEVLCVPRDVTGITPEDLCPGIDFGDLFWAGGPAFAEWT